MYIFKNVILITNNFLSLFIYLFRLCWVFAACFAAGLFSSCGERGPLFPAVHRPLTAVAYPAVEHGP